MVETAKPQRIHAGLYHGPDDERMRRSVLGINGELAPTGREFDDFLVEQMELAFQAGRQQAVFLDIGSGTGELFASVLENLNMVRQSRAFLESHPRFKLRMIGLTDSPTPEDHLKKMPVEVLEAKLGDSSKRINREQIMVSNIFYSLARTQTLDAFLQLQGVEAIDLAMATQSLRYLGPKVFEEVLSTAVSKLPEGGKFIATGLTESIPGYIGAEGNEFNIPEESIHLTATRESFLYWSGVEPGSGEASDLEAEQQAFEEACNTYKRIGVLTQERIKEIRQGIDRIVGVTPRAKFIWFAEDVLHEGFDKLKTKNRARITQQKRQIINGIKDVENQPIQNLFPYDEGVILAKKNNRLPDGF
jgi:hypothetical protein